MAMSFGFLPMVLMLLTAAEGLPPDALSVLQGDLGLAVLGHELDQPSLERLILGPQAPPIEGPAKLSKAAEGAIQNLASRSEKVREKARGELAALGERARRRLEAVAKNDARRAGEAKQVLQTLDGLKSSAGQDARITQLLALRLAASKKMTELAPTIRKVATSAESPFIQIAASDALRTIDKTWVDTAAKLRTTPLDPKELRALPKTTRVLFALNLNAERKPGEFLTMQDFVNKMLEQIPEGAGGGPSEDDLREGRTMVIDWVRQYGNMRPDRVIVANVGPIKERSAGLGIIIRGLYERGVLTTTVSKNPLWTQTEVEGYAMYNSPFLRLVLLSDRSVLILPQLVSGGFPLKEYLGNLKAGRDALSKEPRMARFLTALEDELPLRGFAITDESLLGEVYQVMGLPPEIDGAVKKMKELSLTLAPQGKEELLFRAEGKFADADAAAALTGTIDQGIAGSIAQMEQMMQQAPEFAKQMQPAVEMMKSMKTAKQGKTGIFRYTMKKGGLEMFLMMFGMVSVRG